VNELPAAEMIPLNLHARSLDTEHQKATAYSFPIARSNAYCALLNSAMFLR
jgi:hypothetical protein